MGVETLFLIGGGISTGIKAISALSDANDEADALAARAESIRLQQNESFRRGAREQGLLRRRGRALRGQQTAAFARGGVDIQGTPLAVLEETAFQVEQEVEELDKRLRFEQRALESEQRTLLSGAADVRRAAPFAALGAAIPGIRSIIGSFDSNDGSAVSLGGER